MKTVLVLGAAGRVGEAMSYLWRVPHSLDGSKLARVVPELTATAPLEAVTRAIRDLALDGAAAAPDSRLAA